MDQDTFECFPPAQICEPSETHTHSVIFLHSRGGSGPAIADDLFSTTLTFSPASSNETNGKKTLRQQFPGVRWVFPSARKIWRPSIQEYGSAWFEAYSLIDIEDRSELAMPGLRESIKFIRSIIDEEVMRLDGKSSQVILGGLSLGCATSFWVLLSLPFVLGGFVGASGWFPFHNAAGRYMHGSQDPKDIADSDIEFVPSVIPLGGSLGTPMFIGHGLDDQWVDISLGKASRDLFIQAGYQLDWHEYIGAEMEGHWIKKPEELDDIAGFLGRIVQKEDCL
jgi:lysophospholipase II